MFFLCLNLTALVLLVFPKHKWFDVVNNFHRLDGLHYTVECQTWSFKSVGEEGTPSKVETSGL